MSDPQRPRATVVGAFLEGWRRVLGAPALVFGIWIAATLVALPLSTLLRLETGDTAAARTTWTADGRGALAASDLVGPAAVVAREVHGIGGTIGTVAWITRDGQPSAGLLAALTIYLLSWIFIPGVAADRLARGRPIGGAALAGLGARYVGRLVRLAAVAVLLYWILYRTVSPLVGWLAARVATDALPAPTLAGLGFTAVVALLALLVDFTRVRLVVEDRHSVLASVAAAWRFVRRRLARCAALYAMHLVALAILVRLGTRVAADAPLPGWAAIGVALAFSIALIAARLALLASEVVFFQGELAHATYTAAPVPRWPESASIEAIRNLRRG